MQFEKLTLALLKEAIERLELGFNNLPAVDTSTDLDEWRQVILKATDRMQDNYPYHHPLYAGQMLKPPHPVARVAYALSLWLNPNNHALDGGKASSIMEKEAVGEIARMFGWDTHLGHLCGGGTMANLEALWVSAKLHPGKKIVASEQAHYTHDRICNVLGIEFQAIPSNDKARMDLNYLEATLKEGKIGTVVATLGTTATGSVDELKDIIDLQSKYGFRIHVDAAYGGYFILSNNLSSETKKSFSCLKDVDSIVVDPHKRGLQPYGCGCVLFKDPNIGTLYKHQSPYTYFSSSELHLGEISLECSRAGSSAVALWATQQLLPLIPDGRFSKELDTTRKAALALHARLMEDSRFYTPLEPELDILVWIPRADHASNISLLSRQIFDETASRNLHLALTKLPKELFSRRLKKITWDQDEITCLRSCLMKPEQLDWIEPIWEIIDESMKEVLQVGR